VSLRSEFRVVMSVTISAYKRCSIRLHLQVFVGRLMYYLRYLCLFACSGFTGKHFFDKDYYLLMLCIKDGKNRMFDMIIAQYRKVI
jgi:hypothetical protein